MNITVIYINRNVPTEVARVETPDDLGSDIRVHLEYAFRWTQNTEGSWARRIAPDANDRVTLLKPLQRDDEGNEYGLRSSMVGDLMVVNGQTWTVNGIGFACAALGEKLSPTVKIYQAM